jgi:hypothetical protein
VGTDEEGRGLFIDTVRWQIKEEIAELKSVMIIVVGIHRARFWGRKDGVSSGVSGGTHLLAGKKEGKGSGSGDKRNGPRAVTSPGSKLCPRALF